jgi:hypothetical protein
MTSNLASIVALAVMALAPVVASKSVQADTYVIGPGAVVFNPLVATRVGTTEGPIAANGIAGRVPFTGGATTISSGSFGAPTGAFSSSFSGGGTTFSTSSGGPFGFFGTAQAISDSYSFSPQVRSGDQPGGVLTATATISGASSNILNPFTLVGASVGPAFAASGTGVTSNDLAAGNNSHMVSVVNGATGTINLGAVDFVVGPLSTSTNLQIANNSNDSSFGNVPALVGNQADLNILGVTITGANASLFSLDAGQLATLIGTSLSPGQLANLLNITFTSDGILGVKTAILNILTDQFGTRGIGNDVFSFQLTGVVNPEPASLAIWGMILAGGAFGYGSRRRQKAVSA